MRQLQNNVDYVHMDIMQQVIQLALVAVLDITMERIAIVVKCIHPKENVQLIGLVLLDVAIQIGATLLQLVERIKIILYF